MKKTYIFILFLFFIASVYFIVKPLASTAKQTSPAVAPRLAAKPDMKLTSAAFENYQNIPVDYTCDGEKISPPFSIQGVPPGAKSLAIIVDDPDAPTGVFTHWLVWNIDPQTTEIRPGIAPNASQQGITSAGKQGYVPTCPPSGQHRYFFTLYALDTTVGLDGKAKKIDIETAMKGHVMEESLLIGIYGKQ